MPFVLPEPDGVIQDPRRGEIPAWECAQCGQLKGIDDFGWARRGDIFPSQDVWHRQALCRGCRGNPYEEFLALQERLADAEDLMELRQAKVAEAKKKSIPLAEVKRRLRT